MSISQSSDSSSNAVLTQLLEVDAQLAADEANLKTQLQSIQQKRQSLKTVIDMFAPADTADQLLEAPTLATAPHGENEPAVLEQTTQSVDDSQLAPTPTADVNGKHEISAKKQETPELYNLQATGENTTTEAAEQPNRKRNKAPNNTNRRRTAKTARATNLAKKTERWQDYLREEFSDVPLSIAVSAVLQQQQQALEITSVVDAIFAQQMPPSVRDKAHDRVSNILSEGARKNKWHRADAGSYSMSASAT